MKSGSPYLQNEKRLADVIAAIQVMGTYRYYKLDFASWADQITGDRNEADHWRQVFEQHSEFFRLDSKREKASLVWRRQYPKRYNVDTGASITKEEFINLPDEKKERISRTPLDAETIKSLVQTAIDLHSRELERLQDKRWWIPLIVSGVGGLIGAILGGLL
jgi:hypothetical protein